MAKQLAILAILGLFLFEHCVCTCLSTETSEGFVDLREGRSMCAPLRDNETAADVGKRFLTCSYGRAFTFDCPANLRYDMKTGTCNWPEMATCQAVDLAPAQCPPRPTPLPPPTGTCSASICQLPNCVCQGTHPVVSDQPMFLMVTFDGPVNSYWFDVYYKALTVDNTYNLFNPSGCRSKFAYYVNPDGTDFPTLKMFWEKGNEVGLSAPLSSLGELIRIKEHFLLETRNETLVTSIKGYMAPSISGDAQFDALSDCSFVYDISIQGSSVGTTQEQWPFTLDFHQAVCSARPCISKQHPGLWEVPITAWVGDDNAICDIPDNCRVGAGRWVATEQQWFNFFKENFERIYPTKSPMSIPVRTTMFQNYPNAYRGLVRFLRDTLQTREDVWLATPGQVIGWLQSQRGSTEMKQQKWGC